MYDNVAKKYPQNPDSSAGSHNPLLSQELTNTLDLG